MSVYLIAYDIFRFFIEFLRDDDRGSLIGGISPSQFWSLLMVAAGVGVFFLVRYLYKKYPEQKTVEAIEETQENNEETQEK